MARRLPLVLLIDLAPGAARIAARRLALLAALLLTLGGCEGLFFYPTRDFVLSPERAGLAYRDVWFQSAEGVLLHGWFLPPERGEGEGTVLYFHGNAENISTHLAQVAWLPAQGFGVVLIDYRGFGRSGGTPSIEGILADAEAVLSQVPTIEGVDPDRVAVLGQSLGGSVAITALARSPDRNRFRGLAVEGAFTGFPCIFREKAADLWLTWPLQWPLAATIDGRFDAVDWIAWVSPVPLLVIHGLADPVVPPEHGQDLFAAAREPKDLWLRPGIGHVGFLAEEENRAAFASWLRARFSAPR
jgi:hypothetical protein